MGVGDAGELGLGGRPAAGGAGCGIACLAAGADGRPGALVDARCNGSRSAACRGSGRSGTPSAWIRWRRCWRTRARPVVAVAQPSRLAAAWSSRCQGGQEHGQTALGTTRGREPHTCCWWPPASRQERRAKASFVAMLPPTLPARKHLERHRCFTGGAAARPTPKPDPPWLAQPAFSARPTPCSGSSTDPGGGRSPPVTVTGAPRGAVYSIGNSGLSPEVLDSCGQPGGGRGCGSAQRGSSRSALRDALWRTSCLRLVRRPARACRTPGDSLRLRTGQGVLGPCSIGSTAVVCDA